MGNHLFIFYATANEQSLQSDWIILWQSLKTFVYSFVADMDKIKAKG